MPITLIFRDVGRNRETFGATLEAFDVALLREVVRNGAPDLPPDLAIGAPEGHTGHGVIRAGRFTVGCYRIVRTPGEAAIFLGRHDHPALAQAFHPQEAHAP